MSHTMKRRTLAAARTPGEGEDTVFVAPDGTLWVKRSDATGAPAVASSPIAVLAVQAESPVVPAGEMQLYVKEGMSSGSTDLYVGSADYEHQLTGGSELMASQSVLARLDALEAAGGGGGGGALTLPWAPAVISDDGQPHDLLPGVINYYEMGSPNGTVLRFPAAPADGLEIWIKEVVAGAVGLVTLDGNGAMVEHCADTFTSGTDDITAPGFCGRYKFSTYDQATWRLLGRSMDT